MQGDRDLEPGEPRAEEAARLFEAWVRARTLSEETGIEELCRSHPELEEHLRERHEEWQALLGELQGMDATQRLEATARWSFDPAAPPESFGPYRILSELGSGGMGTVYLAQQTEPIQRQVALKVIRSNLGDALSVSRFLFERQALSSMDHECIARVFDAGTTEDGTPYFAMEYVSGRTLTEYCDDKKLSVPERLELFSRVCAGAQHAHQRGIIHRDLKPNNILVSERDGAPCPKIIDFGISKALGDELRPDITFTLEGQIIGTPEYMSPEQAAVGPEVIDTRSDVYSLGVLLYELLVGALPIDSTRLRQAGYAGIGRLINEEEPPKPSTRASSLGPEATEIARKRRTEVRSMSRQLRGDLDWIVMRCLEKDRGRRYGSASELRNDIERHLANDPILAGPPDPLYRLSKLWRKHRVFLTATAAIGVALVTGLALSLRALERERLAGESVRRSRADERRMAGEREQALRLAAERAGEIAQSNQLAAAKGQEVLALSATKELEDLVAEAESLWPPHPSNVPSLEQWLARANVLVEGHPGDPNRGAQPRPSLAVHKAKLAELVELSEPVQDRDLLALAADHPRQGHLATVRARLVWTRRMLGHEEWPDLQAIREELRPAASGEPRAIELLEQARQSTGPRAHDLLHTGRGKVLAELALDSADDELWPLALMTMAWAEARNDELSGARIALEEALATRPEDGSLPTLDAAESALWGRYYSRWSWATMEQEARELETFLDRWDGPSREARERDLHELEVRVKALETEVGERWVRDPEEAWWQRQLLALIEGIEELHAPDTGLAGDTHAPPFGWGMAHRLRLAQTLDERSRSGPLARERWEEARAAIGASDVYEGLDLPPQLGLLPIGRDPESGLWEFAHLLSGEPAERDTEGTLILREATGIVLVLLPGGRFWMGSQGRDPVAPNYTAHWLQGEGPVHEVQLSPFWISKYEMTQAQWKRITGANPSSYGPEAQWGAYLSRLNPERSLLHPVELVTWNDCQLVMGHLGLELPTEAQWEYACRAGGDRDFWSGPDVAALDGVANLADEFARTHGAAHWVGHESLDDGNTVHGIVGSYRPNPFGLHDVHGNVYEWCRDAYDPLAYQGGLRTDPFVEHSVGGERIYRGGSFSVSAKLLRASLRGSYSARHRFDDLGLRPALQLSPREPIR